MSTTYDQPKQSNSQVTFESLSPGQQLRGMLLVILIVAIAILLQTL